MKLSEIQELKDGAVIPNFEATVKKVFDQKSGQGRYGTWWLQNMIVSQNGTELTATWGGEDSMKSLEGKTMRFSATDGKHGLQGLAWEIRDAKGKTYKSIKITPSAKIAPIGQAAGIAPQATRIEPLPNEQSPSEAFADELARCCNAFYLIEEKMLEEVEQSKIQGFTTTPEHLQAKVSSAFIHLDRSGLMSKLPIDKVWSPITNKIVDKLEEDGEIPW